MTTYLFSPSRNTFYPLEMREAYEAAGDWPPDGIGVNSDVFAEFVSNQSPQGKYRVVGPDNLPHWADIPAPTQDDLIGYADVEKSQRLTVANEKIAPLNDAVELDMATDDEVILLKTWKKYRILLTRVDTSTAPNIDWPEIPA